MSPTLKTIKTHVCSGTNPTAFSKKLKKAPTTLPTMAANASADFLTSLLSASANLSNHFFKVPLSFGGIPHVLLPPPKTPVTARTIVEMFIEMTVSIGAIVIPCSSNRVRILSAKDVSLSRTFLMVCLILENCV